MPRTHDRRYAIENKATKTEADQAEIKALYKKFGMWCVCGAGGGGAVALVRGVLFEGVRTWWAGGRVQQASTE
jgi:hypothetical protein